VNFSKKFRKPLAFKIAALGCVSVSSRGRRNIPHPACVVPDVGERTTKVVAANLPVERCALAPWHAYWGQQRSTKALRRQERCTVAEPSRELIALAQQGDYAGACQALYMAGLARLNDTEAVLYRPSRTDGEYLDCIVAQPSRPYELLIRTHERLVYGDAPATEETYQRCRRAYQEIAQP